MDTEGKIVSISMVAVILFVFFLASGMHGAIIQSIATQEVETTYNITPGFHLDDDTVLMGIGEESTVTWKSTGIFTDAEISVPSGLEVVKRDNTNSKVSIRAVKVGKWEIKLTGPNLKIKGDPLTICVGVTKTKAKRFCGE